MNYYIILGCGGTGGNLAPKLARFTSNEDSILLIDGDIVTENNLLRQPFQKHDLALNKAEALCKKINSVTQHTNCYYIDQYIDENTKWHTIITKDIIQKYSSIYFISCVDNHPARILFENVFKQSALQYKNWSDINHSYNSYKLVFIDSANEDTYGDIVVCNNLKVKLRSNYYPKIKTDNKGKKLNGVCEQIIAEGSLQQYTTNDNASNLILKIISDLKNIKLPAIVYFDTFNLKICHQ
ncbi:ThiF family adenylyltransferase [Spiroplasma sp. DGKH1]|uniref:ThiF family adenylyltransferase n=1 Tax=Spiroplasma sp. DGKH1 TaxID=3050074 RepID=UPI0034C680B9